MFFPHTPSGFSELSVSAHVVSGNAGGRPSTQRTGLALNNDLVFKMLFSRRLDLLSDLINAVRYHAAPIQVVEVLNPSILPEDLEGKQIVLDILAQDANGHRFMVEMQLRRYLHWPERNVYYLARNLSDQLQHGRDYRHLRPAIGISLLDHELFPDYPQQADWHFTLRDTRHPGVQLGQAMQVHIIELPKAERLHGYPSALPDWVACLRHNLDDDRMSQITHPPVQDALKHLQGMYSDEALRLAAERRELALIDEQDALDYARLEGEGIGLHKGESIGLHKGQALMLKRLLERRFGPLHKHALARLETASATEIERWSDQVLDAPSLEMLFQ
ncbi:Rpn family recombination-promoting nuclease/putative transposase [Kerstersia gyiorum]|uniref:Rpn family recombination-promoting nuclease/putative transposase n=1 Tax=Kerstersia gyiorum TaxID=206506 RepID=UPI00242FAD30|nr:Rpn family recombination-promoting nuclease/putative transposase [Kerstersia gyiorum]MCH4270376.1 Rpn family recombination-promoting nuclease/putative transposase [Kerstersia gyiorum]MCI1228886.1 Rpn family recombination-promoting nuclease/putative transposase [Kerstersia gyiorum]